MRTHLILCVLATLLGGCLRSDDGVFPIIIEPGDPVGTPDDDFNDPDAPDDDDDVWTHNPTNGSAILSVYIADNDHDGNGELYANNMEGSYANLLAELDGDDAIPSDYEYVESDDVSVLVATKGGVFRNPLDHSDPMRLSDPSDTDVPKVRATATGNVAVYAAGDPAYLAAVGTDGTGRRVLTNAGKVKAWELVREPGMEVILYTADTDETGQFELRIVGIDGTGDRRISTTAAGSTIPRTVRFVVSPTDTHAMFRSDAFVAGEYELFVTDFIGPPVLVEGAASNLSILDAIWGPKGHAILAMKRVSGAGNDLLHATKDGGVATNLTATFDGNVETFGFDANGTRGAFRADLGELRTTDFVNPPVLVLQAGLILGFEFNADGTRIAAIASERLVPPNQVWIGDSAGSIAAGLASEPDEHVLATAWMGLDGMFVVSDRADAGALQATQTYDGVTIHRRTIDSSGFLLGVEVDRAAAVWEPLDVAGLVGMTTAEVVLSVVDAELSVLLHVAWHRPGADLEPAAESEVWPGNDVRYGTRPSSYYLTSPGNVPRARQPLRGRNFVGLGPTLSNQAIQFKVLATLVAYDPVACLVFVTQYRPGFGAQPSRGTCELPITTYENSFPSSWYLGVDEHSDDADAKPEVIYLTYDEDPSSQGEELDCTGFDSELFDPVDD